MGVQVDKKRVIILLVVILLLLLAGMAWFLSAGGSFGGSGDPVILPAGRPDEAVLKVPVEDIDKRVLDTAIILPAGKLIVTQLRAAYEDGDMRLVIPRLDLDTQVRNDTTLAKLAEGPGLYKYGQIPNIYNTNVSIAGHRDLPPYDFYYADTITEGDFIYLIYMGKVFQYEYRSTEIIEPTNWDPIRCYYDSRVTLTTCHPLGTSRQRMVVVGELIAVEDYTEDYEFA